LEAGTHLFIFFSLLNAAFQRDISHFTGNERKKNDGCLTFVLSGKSANKNKAPGSCTLTHVRILECNLNENRGKSALA